VKKKQQIDATKKKQQIHATVLPELLRRFEAWRAKQYPIPSRSLALRTLLEKALQQEGL